MTTTDINIETLRANADRAVELLKVLANQDRILLLCRIAQGECNVSELENQLQIHQPTLSQQLAVLRRADLVQTRRDGKQIHYRVASSEALAVIATLYDLFCTSPSLPDAEDGQAATGAQ